MRDTSRAITWTLRKPKYEIGATWLADSAGKKYQIKLERELLRIGNRRAEEWIMTIRDGDRITFTDKYNSFASASNYAHEFMQKDGEKGRFTRVV